MTTLSESKPEAPNNSFVQVAVLGGDVRTIDYVEGLSIAQALLQSEVNVEPGQVVTLNGAPVQDFDQTLEPDSVLNVVGRVKNG